MLQPSAPSESTFGTPLYEQQKKATPDLQRQVSSSMGHGGLDEYAAYMSWPESPQAKAPATSPQKLPQKKQPPSTSEREAEPIQLDSSSPPNDLYGSAASPVFETKVEAPKGPQPSTFARGKGENRRDATQLAKEAQSKHLHKPGRPNAPATQTKSQVRGAWADSDESEEESEEEESDDELPQSQSQLQEPSRPARLSQVPQTVEPIQQKEQGHLPKNNVLSQSNGGTSLGLGHAQQQPSNEYSQRSERHASRSLPIPPGQSQSDERVASGGALSQRQASGSPPLHRQPIPRSPSALNRMQQLQVEADETPQRPQSQHRQSFMSMSYPGGQDFQQRPATETQRASFMQHPDDLTGVAGFSADGMLQAGLKNRHDRSAREREAAAREMGGQT